MVKFTLFQKYKLNLLPISLFNNAKPSKFVFAEFIEFYM